MSQDVSDRSARALAEADVRRMFFIAKVAVTALYCALVAIMVWAA